MYLVSFGGPIMQHSCVCEYLINAALILNRIFVSEKGENLTIMMDSCVCARQRVQISCILLAGLK